MNGWVKLHRRLLDKPIWCCSTPEQKAILVTLLLMANHEEREWIWQGEKFLCKPGQFITSLNSIAMRSGTSVQNVKTALKKFEEIYNFLTSKSTNKNRLITIENWDLYQSNEDKLTSKLTSNQQATNKQLTTNKNVKNVKNIRNINNNTKELTSEFKSIIESYTSNTLLVETLLGFIEHRKHIKKPLSVKALKLSLNNLDKLAPSDQDKIDTINQSIMNGWQGLFPLKQQQQGKKPPQTTNFDQRKYDDNYMNSLYENS